jgi:hypothetical protein
VAVQQSGNTITIVGSTGGAAATDVVCTTPCVAPTEISGVLADVQIDPVVARDTEVANAIATHGSASNAHALISFTTGTLAEARIDATIARDTEMAAAITAHSTASDAHTFASISGTLTSAQIPNTITHGLAVSGVVTVAALDASYSHVQSNQSVGAGVSTLSAGCPGGTQVLGGGVQNSDQAVTMLGSWPSANNSWSVSVNNSNLLGSLPVTVYAVCAAIQ